MKRYKSLLSLKWVAALLLVVGFVSCADEEIIDSSNRVVEGFRFLLFFILQLVIVKFE